MTAKAGAKYLVAPTGGGFKAGGDLAGTSTSQTVIGIQGRPVSSAAPSSGQVLEWNGSLWVPTTPSAGGVTSVTAGDASVTASPTTGAVVVEAGTLDQIANLHPPAADWSNNSKKITSLANGSAAQDAAAFGQIPTTLPSPLTVIAQQTTNYTANPWEYVPCNFGGGSFTLTFPAAPADKTQVGFIIQSGSFNVLTIAAGAGDTLATGTSAQYRANGQSAVFEYTASTKVWTALPGNYVLDFPGDASIQISYIGWNPQFETGSLDQVANLHPPIADWTNNSHKITNLANGSAASDAAAFGQIPAVRFAPYAGPTIRLTSASVAANEFTIFGGSSAGYTFTLPSAPPNGTTNSILNGTTPTVTVAAGGTDSIDIGYVAGASTPLVGGASMTITYYNGVWFASVLPINIIPTPGTILATQVYAPVSPASKTVAATTITALDTTNMTLAFIVPASGIVDVAVTALVEVAQTVTPCALVIALLNHSGGALIGSPTELCTTEVANANVVLLSTATFHLTGLTPGALQVDLGAGRTNATGCSALMFASSGSSLTVASALVAPFVMKAIASV